MHLRPDYVGGLLADHDGRRIGVAASGCKAPIRLARYRAASGAAATKSNVSVMVLPPESLFILVIACDKREAFAQGSPCDEAIQLSFIRNRSIFCIRASRSSRLPSVGAGVVRDSLNMA
jgi:hypothetical protein